MTDSNRTIPSGSDDSAPSESGEPASSGSVGADSSRSADDGSIRSRGIGPGRVRRPSVPASVEFARVELRRGYRWLWSQDFWLLFAAAMALFGLLFSVATFRVARKVGSEVAAGEPVPTGFWLAASASWLFLVVLHAWTAVSAESNLDHDGYYLTVRPAADVAGGRLLGAVCKWLVYAGPLALAAAAGLAVGTGAALSVVGVLAAALVVVVTAAAVGFPTGFLLKGAVRRRPGLARHKSIVGFLFGVAYFGLAFTGRWMAFVEVLEPVLLGPPLSWLGDLALVSTPGAEVGVAGAVGAVVLGTFVAVGGTVWAVPAARYAWHADRSVPRAPGDDGAESPPAGRLDRALRPVCRTPVTLAVASTTVRRLSRSPHQLVFVAFPLLAAIPAGERLLTAGTLPWYAPWAVVWYGAWAAGAAVPLNPLGNQGATLPTVLSAPASGREVVHGHVIAALVVAPPAAVLAAGAGVVAGRPGPELVALALAAILAVAAAAVLAAGLGALFPRFGSIDVAESAEAVPPSKIAYGLFSAILTLAVVAGAVVADDLVGVALVALLSETLSFGVAPSTDELRTASLVVLALVALSIPLAYRVAVRRIESYRIS